MSLWNSPLLELCTHLLQKNLNFLLPVLNFLHLCFSSIKVFATISRTSSGNRLVSIPNQGLLRLRANNVDFVCSSYPGQDWIGTIATDVLFRDGRILCRAVSIYTNIVWDLLLNCFLLNIVDTCLPITILPKESS